MVKKLTLSSIGALLLSFPLVLAETHTVSGDLTSFFEAFRCLFHLQSGCVANNLVHAAPLIGLIAVVYGLTYFIAVTTLFKDEDHHKYARTIAIGIAILGVAQGSVYNALLSWSSIFLIATFIVAVIFMFMIFLNHSKKNHYSVAKDMREAHAADLTAKKDLYKIKHDVALDKKYYDRVMHDLDSLNQDLTDLTSLAGSEKSQVNEIARLLQQLASAANRGEQGFVHQYAQALANHIGALISSMKHEDVIDNNVDNMVEQIDSILAHWDHTKMKDEAIEKQMLHIFKQVSAHLGHDYDEKEYSKLLVDNKLLANHFTNMHRILRELSSLRDHLNSQTEHLTDLGYKKKHLEASEIRDSVFEGDYSRAHKHLDNLRSIIEQEPNVSTSIGASASKIRSLISQLRQEEEIVQKLSRNEIAVLSEKMAKDSSRKKAVISIRAKYSQELIYSMKSLLSNLDSYDSEGSPIQILIERRTLRKLGLVGSNVPVTEDVEVTINILKDIVKFLNPSSLKSLLVEVEKSISSNKSIKFFRGQFVKLLDTYLDALNRSKHYLTKIPSALTSRNHHLLTHLHSIEMTLDHSESLILNLKKEVKSQEVNEEKDAKKKNLKPEEI